MNLGTNIKKLRLEKNMTQEDLAQLLNTSIKSVSRWENGVTYPDITLLPLIANIFETTTDKLLDVEKVKMEEYIISLKEKAYNYQKSNELYSELKMWEEAYKNYPNNEEISIRYASVMGTVNCMENKIIYKKEIITLCERLLEKSNDHFIRDWSSRLLVDLYSMLDNIDKSDFYARQLSKTYFETYDVVKTLYLRGNDLKKAIQNNTVEFISEINRENEFLINNERMDNSLEYRKQCLEKVIKLNEIFFDNNDYGYNATSYIFNYIDLAKMIIQTSNEESKVIECFDKINEGIVYIDNFQPHYLSSPLLNTIYCEHIGGYNVMLMDIKKNILKSLDDDIFNNYKEKKRI